MPKTQVMIISYYEAQRKKAEDELKELGDYELLTVDSAQVFVLIGFVGTVLSAGLR